MARTALNVVGNALAVLVIAKVGTTSLTVKALAYEREVLGKFDKTAQIKCKASDRVRASVVTFKCPAALRLRGPVETAGSGVQPPPENGTGEHLSTVSKPGVWAAGLFLIFTYPVELFAAGIKPS